MVDLTGADGSVGAHEYSLTTARQRVVRPFYAAGLSVIETCRKRGIDPWTYGRDLIAAARKGSTLPGIPAKAIA